MIHDKSLISKSLKCTKNGFCPESYAIKLIGGKNKKTHISYELFVCYFVLTQGIL